MLESSKLYIFPDTKLPKLWWGLQSMKWEFIVVAWSIVILLLLWLPSKTWYDNQHCCVHDMPLVIYKSKKCQKKNILQTGGTKIPFWQCPIFNTHHTFMEHHCASKIRIRYQELDIKTWYVRKWCHMFSYTSVWCHVAPVKAEITGRATRVNLMKRLMTAGGDKKGFGNICWHHLIASFRSGAIWTSGGV